MNSDDLIIVQQQKQIVKEMGQLFVKEIALTDDWSSAQYAQQIAHKLQINYGSSLSLVFWLNELQEIYPENKEMAEITQKKRKRLIQLGRLIQLAAGKRGLSFCCSRLPQYAVNNFKALLNLDDGWKEKSHGAD